MTSLASAEASPAPASGGEPLLQATNIHKEYRDGERTLAVLRGANLRLGRGEYVSIIGQSGSGKSTLLHLLGALDRATKGEIVLNGQTYSALGGRELNRLRNRSVGFIYQFHHLLPDFTALENVCLPAMISRERTAVLMRRAEELLRRVGLSERLTHRPAKLSGGEQQRVALARALMNDPQIVLADEPTGDLDQKTGREVMDFVMEETLGQGRSLIIVTHDQDVAARAQRTYRLENGQLTESRN